MENVLFLDFETRSECDLKAAGSHVYATHPSTQVLCLGYAFNEEDVSLWEMGEPIPFDILEHIESGGKVVGHNIGGFEVPVWNGAFRRDHPEIPELKIEQCYDTMVSAYAMNLPGNLEGAAAALGLDQLKDMTGNRVMMSLAKPRAITAKDIKNGIPEDAILFREKADHPDKFRILGDYCKQDVVVERDIYKRVLPLSPKERAIWILDYKINNRGVRADLKAAKVASELVKYEKTRLDAEMRRVSFNKIATCSAVQQLQIFLKSYGVNVESVAKGDVIELLNDESLPKICREVLELRQEAAKASTAKLEKMLSGAGEDGRMRGLFQYHGAPQTGRWGGRRVQLQNLKRPSIKQEDVEGVFELLKGKH